MLHPSPANSVDMREIIDATVTTILDCEIELGVGGAGESLIFFIKVKLAVIISSASPFQCMSFKVLI